ncbi:hypothetical protein F7Q99_07830 [Streptomyces kaniharaensis]|uniref:Uncharacterized protein n=1 Tax=Streptomyces kaniharaensis TaxID=212423 RepID=A0A6N7KN98_9ACTN|nr:hypothetical protein [Streptomyces kaniharaensis]MQS12205.1 hypothetical protein [Streptomyces kaniharaensis]
MRGDLRTWLGRVVWWWSLRGQFFWPVWALSPRRRAAHRAVAAWFAEPGYLDSSPSRLMRRIWREHTGVDDPLAGLNEAELFRRIFGRDHEGSAR